MSAAMYKKLKKQNGEKFAQTVRNFHSGLLEIPELDVILRHAGRNAQPLLPYLMTLMASNDDEDVAPAEPQDPFELLDQAGYDAFHADTLKKQNSIKPYFRKGELLCTFNDKARYKNYHIVNAVKKNVDEIERGDPPERQDEYGTSVISIQMAKRGGFISIKNRYNHTVTGCDNTFNSNPDHIIRGLSTALKNHFNVEFSATKSSLPGGYVLIGNQVFKYHRESNNIYYGDQAWAKDGEIHAVDKSAGDALFEEYLFDNKTKTLKNVDPRSIDSFPDDFNRTYGGNRGLNVQKGNLMLDGDILIGAEGSRMKTLYLPELTIMGDNCLRSVDSLTHFNTPNLTTMGDGCLLFANSLTQFNTPELTTMGDGCLRYANSLTQFNTPELTIMGNRCLRSADSLTHFNTPELTIMGDDCLRSADSLTHFNTPELTTMGDDCLEYADSLTQFNTPNLTIMGNGCLRFAPKEIKRSMKHLRYPQWMQKMRLRFEAREFTPVVEYAPHI